MKQLGPGRFATTARTRLSLFWDGLVRITDGSAQPSLDVSVSFDAERLHLKLLEPARLTNVRLRPTGKKADSADVSLGFTHSLAWPTGSTSFSDGTIVGGTVDLHYTDVDDNSTLRRMHFDYHEGANHPLFHVQISDRVGARVDTPRIPTAPMHFCNVVFMLLHDHFPYAIPEGWPAELSPHVLCGFRVPIANPRLGTLDCVDWYPD